MEVNKEEMETLLSSMVKQNKLEPEQIPELDLYIDQILMLFEDKLGENRRHEKDKILTKSMVNNYSKEKMIRPMRGKKYTREQILQILMICNLKNILSIGDIKQVMTILMEEEISTDGLEEIFKQNQMNHLYLKEGIDLIVSNMEKNYPDKMDMMDMASMLLGLASISSYCKRTSEAIIDRFFCSMTAQKPQNKK